jgi:hypothetical protein
MKTRSRDTTTTPGLPPPPAPTSRDANPWSMGEVHAADRTGIPPAAHAQTQTQAPARPRRFPTKPPDSIKGRRRSAALPLVILSFIAMIAVGLVVDALESGKLEEAIGPIIAVVFVAFMIVRQLRRRRS